MTLDDLKQYELVYLATPYTLYYMGLDQAYTDACRLTSDLMVRGIRSFSPIAQGHGLSVEAGVSPGAVSLWYWFNQGYMNKCDALVVGCLHGWLESKGVQHEIAEFLKQRKPRYLLDPFTRTVTKMVDS